MSEVRAGRDGCNLTSGKRIYMTDDLTPLTEAISNIDGPILFFNIGSACSGGDSFGPILGNLLTSKRVDEYDASVIGTTDNAITAPRIPFVLKYALQTYPHHTVIATDAAIGAQAGRYSWRNEPLRPGAGLKKELPLVGDYHLMAAVALDVGDEEPVDTADRVFFCDREYTRSLAKRACDAIVAGLKLRQQRKSKREMANSVTFD